MRQVSRLAVTTGVLFLCAVAAAFTATQNYLPKFNKGNSLVDSVMYESGGNIGIGSGGLDAKFSINQNADAKGLQLNVPITGLTQPALSVNYDGTESTAPLLLVQSGSPKVDRFLVTAAGNVGIGTLSPNAKLHVAGNVTVDGNIGAKYQDVAEWVSAGTSIEAGMVVVADRTSADRVVPSQKAYDTAVAGVVSKQPGIILGEPGKGKVAVAQSGRVRVKVDAAYGAISPGDLLVTSPTPGYAMRSQALPFGQVEIHRPGTILGKALESLDGGRGEVLALITLQ